MRFDRFGSLLLAFILGLSIFWAGKAIAQTAPTREEMQRELISSMVGVYSGVWLGELPRWQGEVPSQISTLPLPDEARIIGSINQVDVNFQVYLDVPRSTDQVESSYPEQLRQAGWREDLDSFYEGLDVAIQALGLPLGSPSIFCKADQFLLLWTTPLPNAPATSVRLHLGSATQPGNFCNPIFQVGH